MKKILIVTQSIDRNNLALGFFHDWVKEFASKFESIVVVCLEKGDYDLPSNVKVVSLGKEKNRIKNRESRIEKIRYIWRFYKILWRERNSYESVFVHMNQEYVILAGLWWKITNKKIGFWYNHTHGSIFTKVAMLFADIVFHTSPFAFTANTKKSIKMPAGIDTEKFKKNTEIVRIKNSILFIGRLAPVKDLVTLIKALLILEKRNIEFTLDVYGEALEKNRSYEAEVYVLAKPLLEAKKVKFHGGVLNSKTPMLYSSHEVFVNLTPKGNFDKTVLEAMACESIVLVSSEAFSDIIPKYIFLEKDPSALAEKLENIFSFSIEKKGQEGKSFREIVVKSHDIKKLVEKIYQII